MSLDNAQNPHIIRVPLGVVSADTTFKACTLGTKKAVVKSVKIVDPTGLAAHDTNYVKAQLKKSSTLLAEWSTKLTGGEGALVAGTWATMPEANIEVDGGDLDVVIDIEASGALTAGSVAQIEMYYV